ncbi:spermatogenesis-associated protein 19, mitochondrial [Hemicordylus capensis]|uniref:spermatogenesis-associated protein 19, mitochondrial n=1 Tax=Hemicordylus capensis TaxID=884348 RepID=UPI00230351D3|nr:spermatogenesis-associated protein 19, mitochondrial [Hemicordylus capensis]
MIVATWAVYILVRRVSRQPIPPGNTPDDCVIETEIVSVLEHWLRKIEDEAAKIFRQKSENRTDSKGETRPGIRYFSVANQDFETMRSNPETFEHSEDRRNPQTVQVSRSCSSSSQDLVEDRTRIQFIRWSHTRVYSVPSDMKKDAVQERLDKVRKSVSRVMFQADAENDILLSDVQLQTNLSES